ncbi:MAG: hypothetical protein IJF83_11630 [Methanobrevibacter sp.]|nr:hypothetical protein [Methanobrevibacter sp.]
MTILNIPDDFITFEDEGKIVYDFNFTVFRNGDKVRFCTGEIATSWLDLEDSFIDRIQFENLNPDFLERHLAKEIEIKNALVRGADFLNKDDFIKAIGMFDEVLYYDPEHGEALLLKSKALFGQGHFVKSLRHYKRAVKSDSRLKDVEYHKLLLAKSSKERDNFPKIKRNIYAGDEYFAKGEFTKALESYDKALVNPSNFKNKILSKLLNKKATALLKLDLIDDAVSVFKESVSVKPNDYAFFYLGIYDYDSSFDEFKRHLNITKKQLILKARKLYENGEGDLALECLDEFFDNHYRVDDDYNRALELKLKICNG